VVGIVARRDLLRLVARGDNDIRADLQRRLQEQVHALQRLDLQVEDGILIQVADRVWYATVKEG
jgi:hypothetical protein